MYIIILPYKKVSYLCAICGFGSRDKKTVEECEARIPVEVVDLRMGDSIQLSEYKRVIDKNGRWMEVLIGTYEWTIADIYYAQPGRELRSINDPDSIWEYGWIKPHTLCISLQRRLENDSSGFIAASRNITYEYLKAVQGGSQKIINRR